MTRFFEHYSHNVKEELVLSTSSTNIMDLPKIKGMHSHMSLKNLNFDQYGVAPLMLTQELTTGTGVKANVAKTSDPAVKVRKDQVTGLSTSLNSNKDLLNFMDSWLWHLANIDPLKFSGWSYNLGKTGNLGIRLKTPFYELNELSDKDEALSGVQACDTDWTLNMTSQVDSLENIRLLQGFSIPFEGISHIQKKRKNRSKTVRKMLMKMKKVAMKAKKKK